MPRRAARSWPTLPNPAKQASPFRSSWSGASRWRPWCPAPAFTTAGYLTSDGALAVGCLSPTVRQRFRQAVGFEDPGENPTGIPQRVVNHELVAHVERLLKQKTTDAWMDIFDRHSVPAGPVRFVEELADDPQVLENGYVVELEHDLTGPQRMAAPPFQMSETPTAAQGAAPPLGRDTFRWLTALGYDEAEVRAMSDEGVVYLGIDGDGAK